MKSKQNDENNYMTLVFFFNIKKLIYELINAISLIVIIMVYPLKFYKYYYSWYFDY